VSKGYVYILINPSMPGLVKIGKTTRTPQQRCEELWHTGVPTPFEVFAAVFSPDCHRLERDMHMAFRSARISASREFFQMSAFEAREELEHWHLKQVDQLLAEFLPDHRAVHESIALDEEEIGKLGEDLAISPADVVRAIPFVDPKSLSAALREYQHHHGDCRERI
jgi:hypothetical protein